MRGQIITAMNISAESSESPEEPTPVHLLGSAIQVARSEAGQAAQTVCGVWDTWPEEESAYAGAGGAGYVDCPMCFGMEGGLL